MAGNSQKKKGDKVILNASYQSVPIDSQGIILKLTTVDGEPAAKLDLGLNAGGQKLTSTIPLSYLSRMAEEKEQYWNSPVPVTDDFDSQIREIIIDGRTKSGRWALMTPESWAHSGIEKFGPGYGQMYQYRQSDDKWVDVTSVETLKDGSMAYKNPVLLQEKLDEDQDNLQWLKEQVKKNYDVIRHAATKADAEGVQEEINEYLETLDMTLDDVLEEMGADVEVLKIQGKKEDSDNFAVVVTFSPKNLNPQRGVYIIESYTPDTKHGVYTIEEANKFVYNAFISSHENITWKAVIDKTGFNKYVSVRKAEAEEQIRTQQIQPDKNQTMNDIMEEEKTDEEIHKLISPEQTGIISEVLFCAYDQKTSTTIGVVSLNPIQHSPPRMEVRVHTFVDGLVDGVEVINAQGAIVYLTNNWYTTKKYEAADFRIIGIDHIDFMAIAALAVQKAKSLGIEVHELDDSEISELIAPANPTPVSDLLAGLSQVQINEKIHDLIAENEDDASKYSPEEMLILDQYEGAGGLGRQPKIDAERTLDQFFTSREVCAFMWGMLKEFGLEFKKAHFLEPACGTGRFLEYIPMDEVGSVDAYDIDPICATITKLLYPDANVFNHSFEEKFFDIKGINARHTELTKVTKFYDVVIGNPPYRDYKSEYSKQGEKDATGARTFDQYFLMRGIDLLKPGGLLCYIIPNTFMHNEDSYNGFKDVLNSKAELLKAYRMPNGIFRNTEIGTDILIFRKRESIFSTASQLKVREIEEEIVDYDRKITKKDIGKRLLEFMPEGQLKFLKEQTFESQRTELERMQKQVSDIPEIYAQDGKGDEALVYVHYFIGSTDIWLTEANIKEGSGYGYMVLGGDTLSGEFGYQSLEEIRQTNGIQMDFHWSVKPMGEIKGVNKEDEPDINHIHNSAGSQFAEKLIKKALRIDREATYSTYDHDNDVDLEKVEQIREGIEKALAAGISEKNIEGFFIGFQVKTEGELFMNYTGMLFSYQTKYIAGSFDKFISHVQGDIYEAGFKGLQFKAGTLESMGFPEKKTVSVTEVNGYTNEESTKEYDIWIDEQCTAIFSFTKDRTGEGGYGGFVSTDIEHGLATVKKMLKKAEYVKDVESFDNGLGGLDQERSTPFLLECLEKKKQSLEKEIKDVKFQFDVKTASALLAEVNPKMDERHPLMILDHDSPQWESALEEWWDEWMDLYNKTQ